jgi:hypothetical protein
MRTRSFTNFFSERECGDVSTNVVRVVRYRSVQVACLRDIIRNVYG